MGNRKQNCNQKRGREPGSAAPILTRSVSEVRPGTSLTLRVVIGCINLCIFPLGRVLKQSMQFLSGRVAPSYLAHASGWDCFRFAIAAFVLLLSLDCVAAQTDSDRKRFKHEKHGAIVFAKGENYELKCDIYQPKSDEPRPVMLAIHGGAWRTGTKFAMLRHARILANRGYVVMSLNYRLAPDHPWPAQIHDCKHAVRWIREHAAEYNADPDRVYAFGYSAGGHLATMLATSDEDDGLEGDAQKPYAKHSSRVQGLIAGGAPVEFTWIGDEATTLEYWLGSTKAEDPKGYANASPATFVTKDDPPMVLYHGMNDVLVPLSSPTRFVERCKETELQAELLTYNGGHAAAFTFTSSLIESLELLEAMLAKRRCREKIAKLTKLANAFQETLPYRVRVPTLKD